MVEMQTRLESVSEFVVSPGVTAPELTRCVDELVDGQVRVLATLYQRLVAEVERTGLHMKPVTRRVWLTKSRLAAGAGDPSVIRRRLAQLPPCAADDDRSDIP